MLCSRATAANGPGGAGSSDSGGASTSSNSVGDCILPDYNIRRGKVLTPDHGERKKNPPSIVVLTVAKRGDESGR
jgi:hypothetical protein